MINFNNPYVYPYSQSYVSQYQNYVQPQQVQSTIQDIVRVHGKEGALKLGNSLGANRAALVIDDSETDIAWCIATDGAGLPSLKRLKMIDAPEDNNKTVSSAQNEDFVSRKEFDLLVSKVDDMNEIVKELKE